MTTEIVSFKHLENALQVSISANAAVVSTRSVEIKSEVQKSIAILLDLVATGGHSKTTWTNFCPILTTYLPIVDFRGHLVHYLPFVYVDIEKTNHLLLA